MPKVQQRGSALRGDQTTFKGGLSAGGMRGIQPAGYPYGLQSRYCRHTALYSLIKTYLVCVHKTHSQ